MTLSSSPSVSLDSAFRRHFSASSSISSLMNAFAPCTVRPHSTIPAMPRPSRPSNTLLHTQESPQLQSLHAFTSYFADTPGYPSLHPVSSIFFHTLATHNSPLVTLPTRRNTCNSKLLRRLLLISLDTQGLPPYSPLSAKSQPAARLKQVVAALQKRCPSSHVHLASGRVCPGGT
jgi:hypothetical protein